MGQERRRDETFEDEIFEAGPGAALDRVVQVEGGTRPEPPEEWEAHTAAQAKEGAEAGSAHSEHSPWPAVLALGLLLLGAGLLSNPAISALGAIVVMVAVVAWMWEPWTS